MKAVNKGFFNLGVGKPLDKSPARNSMDSSLFVVETRPCFMADVNAVVQRSMNINENWALASLPLPNKMQF